MKLKRVKQQPEAGYPTFVDYQENRHSYLRGLVAGAGALLAAGFGSAYGANASGAGAGSAGGVQTAGVPPPPEQKLEALVKLLGEPPPPVTPAATCPVSVKGEMVAPKAPVPVAVNTVQPPGGIKAPTAPKPAPARPVALDGDMAYPPPPRPPDPKPAEDAAATGK